MVIEKKNTADLLPAEYNPRKNLKPGDAEYEKLKRSIEQFGYVEPVIWNKTTGRVVGGHQRLKVLIDMGITEVDCVVVELSEDKEKALNIALNKISGEWDKEKLALLITDLQGADFDVSLTGFEPAEIDDLFKDSLKDGIKDDDFDVESELKKPTITKPGDIWTLGRHRLICGDSTLPHTYEMLMGDTKANLVITDPPYNVNYEGSAGKIKNDNMENDAFYGFLFNAFVNMERFMADDAYRVRIPAVKYTVSPRNDCVLYISNMTCYSTDLEVICVYRKGNKHRQRGTHNAYHKIWNRDRVHRQSPQLLRNCKKHAAKTAAAFLNGTCEYIGTYYRTYEVAQADGRKWKFMSDGSINTQRKENGQKVRADKDYSVEMVSPILTYREDIETLQGLVRELRKAGGFPNNSCGIHIHLDGSNHTPKSIRNFINIIASKNDLLYKALQINPERARFCKKMDSELVEKLNRVKKLDFETIENIWYDGYYGARDTHYHDSRYHFANLHSFFHGHRTVELRGFNSTLHAGEIRSYIVLALALNHQALTQRSASTKKPQVENEKFAMRTYLNRIGFIGDEFKNCREHLTKHLDGSAAWRFGTPAA